MQSRTTFSCITLLSVLVVAGFSGCRSQQQPVSAPPTSMPQTAVHSYALHGTILGIGTQTGELTIRHDEIHGFMPAMTMNFKVLHPDALAKLKVGDEIRATLQVQENAESYPLENIQVIGHADAGAQAALPAHTLLKGELVPDIAIENQDGKKLRLSSYAGRYLLVTFIYTRCPLPNACPKITTNYARIYNRMMQDPELAQKAHLISITLDPAYDEPKVLNNYGRAFQASSPHPFAHWEFVRTSPSDLRKLANAFGLEYTSSNNQITHTMRTVLIGPDRTVRETWYGSGWTPDEVVTALWNAPSLATQAAHHHGA